MSCPYLKLCGGCPQRNKTEAEYQKQKEAFTKQILSEISTPFSWGNPVFIKDGTRRRASLAFEYRKRKLALGFNRYNSNDIVDVESCALLRTDLNDVLPFLRKLMQKICSVSLQIKKGKKTLSQTINNGDIWLCVLDGGVDVVLEYDAPLSLEHRMILFEEVNANPQIIRLSHRRSAKDVAEPIVEKSKPTLTIGGVNVSIPAGTFLQPSKEGEEALICLVKKYLGESGGKIADLFCGVGTFSYALAQNKANKILAADSSVELLKGFQETVNRNQVPNIKIVTRNLFKYPLDAEELKDIDVVVFDPPRAGAAAQAKVMSLMPIASRPQKIIAISCNPATFVNDANTLIQGGYKLQEVTMVDQFTYSNHSELVALFTN